MDSSPAGLFDSYDQDFKHIIQGIRDKLDGSGKPERGEQRKAALRRVEIELDEADDIVSQLEIESQGIPKSLRPQYTSRLKQAKAELAKYKKLSKESHAQLARTDLLGPRGPKSLTSNSDDPYDERSERARLLTGTEILSDGRRRLTDSTRLALETEEQGADILRTLRVQREQIENSRDMVRTSDSHIDRAAGTLKGMIMQMYKQRVILGAIAVFFVILILVILYLKLVRR
ncbi:vesicle transport v-snare protein vti1 [Amanita rubescens]|nr:vesicle transport v-snare protein vti1 [Amanita rubescens]KAF8337125.1 vesicle transport v-snare protein vti1 [Amanita rubescens]